MENIQNAEPFVFGLEDFTNENENEGVCSFCFQLRKQKLEYDFSYNV